MSYKAVYTCDHCGAECTGDQYASIGGWEEPKAIAFGKTIHGCSKEHLGHALAKAFGIGVDGRCAGIITAKDLEISGLDKRILDLEKNLAFWKAESKNDREARSEAEAGLDRVNRKHEEAEKQLAAFTDRPVRDNVDHGQTAYEAHEALPGVRLAHIDRGTKSTPWADLQGLERKEWRAIGGAVVASITEQTKPTKPAMMPYCSECKQEGKFVDGKWVCIPCDRSDRL